MGNRRVFRLAEAFLTMASGFVIPAGQAASWTEIDTGLPSAPVNVSAIVIAPTQPSVIYARTISTSGVGGIFKSTDGAGSWKPISSIVGVYSLVADPQNPSTIYALTSRGIVKSTNGGDTWIGAGAGLANSYINSLTIDPVSPSKLYAVTGNGIFKSTDGGGNWNALDTGLPPNTYIASLAIDPTNPSHIYATSSIPQNGGPPKAVFLKSIDEGQSWNSADPGLPANFSIRSLTISSTAPSVIYAIADLSGFNGPPGAGILKSTDGGDNWTVTKTGLPSGADVTSMIIDPTNSSTIYLGVIFSFAEAGGILKSTDGGASWNAIKPNLPANTPIQYLAIDPVSSTTMYTIANGIIFRSTDGGINWNSAATGLTSIGVSTLAVNPVDATVYTGAGNSLFKSVDGGAGWNKLFAFQISVSSVPTFIASPFPDGSPAYPTSLLIDSVNPNVLYVSTSRGNGCYFADNLMFKSTDGGMSWNNNISPVTSGCVLGSGFGGSAGLKAIDPTDPNTLYLAEADDGDGSWLLLKTQDGGVNWNSLGDFPGRLQTGVWTLAIDPAMSTTLYAGLDDVPTYSDTDNTVTPGAGGVFKSTDGGASWNSIGLSGAAVNLLAIDPTQPTVLYAVTEGNYGTPRGFRGIFKSTDGGVTWSAIDNGLDSLLATGSNIAAIVIDPANSNVLYVGASGGGVFKSSDGGATWNQFNDGLANLDVRALAMAPDSGHSLYAGTSGGIFKIDTAR